MTKQEFIDTLSAKLSEDLDQASVYDEVRFYIGYIDAEVAKGRTEEDVTAELGDPILIARNISESPRTGRTSYAEDSYLEGYTEAEYQAEKREPQYGAVDEDFSELPPYKEPEERTYFDNGFFERQGPQEARGQVEDGSQGFSSDFNWGLITGVLAVLLLVALVVMVVAHVVRILWPVIVVMAIFTGISSFFRRR